MYVCYTGTCAIKNAHPGFQNKLHFEGNQYMAYLVENSSQYLFIYDFTGGSGCLADNYTTSFRFEKADMEPGDRISRSVDFFNTWGFGFENDLNT